MMWVGESVETGGNPRNKELKVYNVIDCSRGDIVDSTWDNKADAMARCVELAEEQSGTYGPEVSEYENLGGEMGACPEGDPGGYWPYVAWSE
jgi:hypothetical protein